MAKTNDVGESAADHPLGVNPAGFSSRDMLVLYDPPDEGRVHATLDQALAHKRRGHASYGHHRDAEYAGERKQTRKELFLIEMHQVVPWQGLIALIEPHYPKGDGGRPAYPLMAMLRVHLMQNWFGYSDPAMEEALYETTILRQFAGLRLERIPDETRSSTSVVCWRNTSWLLASWP